MSRLEMKRILALFITLPMIFSFAVGAISGVNEDLFAEAVLDEQAQLALEKAAIEFAKGNDIEGLTFEDNATNNFGKTQLGFLRISGAVITASWCGYIGFTRIHKPYCCDA